MLVRFVVERNSRGTEMAWRVVDTYDGVRIHYVDESWPEGEGRKAAERYAQRLNDLDRREM
jgi:hypothetical protein